MVSSFLSLFYTVLFLPGSDARIVKKIGIERGGGIKRAKKTVVE